MGVFGGLSVVLAVPSSSFGFAVSLVAMKEIEHLSMSLVKDGQLVMDEIKRQAASAMFPRASKAFRDSNPQLFASQPEQDIRTAVVDEAPGKEKGNVRARVCIVMFRVRLLDPDNAYGSAKPLIDCLRTCGLISDDSEKEIDLQVSQKKVDHFNEQRTEVKIVYGR